jgi:hypothetical protein
MKSNFHILSATHRCGIFAAAMLLLASNSFAALVTTVASNFVAQTQKGQLTDRQEWFLKSTVGVYKTLGQRDPKWDAIVIETMESFAVTRSAASEQRDILEANIGVAAKKAQELGCKDPLIEYLSARFTQRQSITTLLPAVRNFGKSEYPSGLKVTARCTVISFYGENKKRVQEDSPYLVKEMYTNGLTQTIEALGDTTFPLLNAYTICEDLIEIVPKMELTNVWKELKPHVDKRFASTHYAHLLQANVSVLMAWAIRGNGYAPTVDEDKWPQIEAHNKFAYAELKRAWSIDTNDAAIANKMLEVLLLDSDHVKEMELWFARAMRCNSNNIAACWRMFNALKPRWYGSEKELLAFGHLCLTNKAWGPDIGKIVIDIHKQIASDNDFVGAEKQKEYYSRREVWADIKTAFERVFSMPMRTKIFSENLTELKKWAELCGHSDEVDQIIQKNKPGNSSRTQK